MTARLAALSPRARVALAVGAVLVYALAIFLLVVSPRRSDAATLSADAAAAEVRLAELQAGANRSRTQGTPVADVFRLAKAMPSSGDQAGLVLELDRLARSSRVTLGSVTLQDAAVDGAGATLIPVVVTVSGSYRQVQRFLQLTRTLVTVRRGELRSTGRLFAVQNIEIAESATAGFPVLDVTVSMNAYVYDGPIVPPSLPPPTGDESSSSSTSAAGSTP